MPHDHVTPEILHRRLIPAGQIIFRAGEMALFNARRRSTFARARTTCELALISGSKIERLIADAEPGVRALLRLLVRRLADLNDQIEVCPETGHFRMTAA